MTVAFPEFSGRTCILVLHNPALWLHRLYRGIQVFRGLVFFVGVSCWNFNELVIPEGQKIETKKKCVTSTGIPVYLTFFRVSIAKNGWCCYTSMGIVEVEKAIRILANSKNIPDVCLQKAWIRMEKTSLSICRCYLIFANICCFVLRAFDVTWWACWMRSFDFTPEITSMISPKAYTSSGTLSSEMTAPCYTRLDR